MRRFRFCLGPALFALFLAGCSGPQVTASMPATKKLPPACEQGCVTPYGAVLGRSAGGVEAYSNCSARCVSMQPHRLQGTYLGMRWQCVEYARRWLFARHGVVYGDVDVAADIWSKITHYERVADKAKLELEKHQNGGGVAPRAGDLIIYSREYLKTGHVAVVLSVDLGAGSLKVAEQNYRNERWPGMHARELRLETKQGRFELVDEHILGWVRAKEKLALTPRVLPATPSR